MTRTLPSHWYHDVAIYNQEKDKIFKQAWWPVGPERALVAAGVYCALKLFGHPLLLVRGHDQILRAFHNVCRHRASPLLQEGAGTCGAIRCPYHGWLYGLDGKLQKAPLFGDDNGFDPNEHGLMPVRVENWRGLVFVCLSDKTSDLLSWLGSVDTLCATFPGPEDLDLYKSFEIQGSANWKAYCDNTLEGYHLNLVHPRLAQALAKGSVEIKSYDEGRVVAFHVTYGSQSEGAQLRGNEGVWVYRFPGFQLTASANVFKGERIEPAAPNRLRSMNWLWYQGISEEQVEDACAWSELVVHEDLSACEGVQANLEAGAYTDGPLSPLQETHVARFQSLVRGALGA